MLQYERMGTLLRYPGSKNKIAKKIISLFPDNYCDMTYLEPFFGSGAVFLRKVPSIIETINDINGDVYNLFLQIRENAEELARLIEFTPWSRQEYEEAYNRNESEIENARRFLVHCWQSIGAKMCGITGWRHNIKTNAGYIEGFYKVPEIIEKVTNRLKPKPNNIVQIENKDAFVLIEKYNRDNVLIYLDPPYVLNTRKNKKYYSHEMSNKEHEQLCEIIIKSQAKIILSGYENEIYNSYLKNFNKIQTFSYDEKGNKRTEVLWRNFNTADGLFNKE